MPPIGSTIVPLKTFEDKSFFKTIWEETREDGALFLEIKKEIVGCENEYKMILLSQILKDYVHRYEVILEYIEMEDALMQLDEKVVENVFGTMSRLMDCIQVYYGESAKEVDLMKWYLEEDFDKMSKKDEREILQEHHAFLSEMNGYYAQYTVLKRMFWEELEKFEDFAEPVLLDF